LSGQVHTNQTIEHYKLTLSLRDNFSVLLARIAWKRLQRSTYMLLNAYHNKHWWRAF